MWLVEKMKIESGNNETIEIIEIDGLKIKAILRSDGVISFDPEEFWILRK